MMRRVVIAAGAGVCLLGLGFWLGSAVASTGEPGSAADPLVSKSYVDSLVSFQVVSVARGAAVVGESGTEIVVRGGQGTVIASSGGGVLDTTAGADLEQGAVVEPNHLLVVPRADGRGVLATTDLILLVKGAFTVRPAESVPAAPAG